MVNWLTVRKDPIEAVEHGVQESEQFFNNIHTGPRDFGRMDYPCAQVLPRSTQRADARNWRHEIMVNLFFERGRELDYIEDVLHPTADVLDNVLGTLGTVDCATNYHPANIQDFAGELDNTQLLLVSIEFQIKTLIDPSEFSD